MVWISVSSSIQHDICGVKFWLIWSQTDHKAGYALGAGLQDDWQVATTPSQTSAFQIWSLPVHLLQKNNNTQDGKRPNRRTRVFKASVHKFLSCSLWGTNDVLLLQRARLPTKTHNSTQTKACAKNNKEETRHRKRHKMTTKELQRDTKWPQKNYKETLNAYKETQRDHK